MNSETRMPARRRRLPISSTTRLEKKPPRALIAVDALDQLAGGAGLVKPGVQAQQRHAVDEAAHHARAEHLEANAGEEK